MKQELINHFSGWWLDLALHPENYYLVLSDDMDSYYSCRYLKKQFNIEIGGFYQFGNGLFYTTDRKKIDGKSPVFIDCACALDGVMCFDNHRTMINNHMAINPNIITDRAKDSYYQKYNGSTLMLLVALYGGQLTNIEKEFIIAMDGFYIGYYKYGGRFKKVNEKWLDILGLTETLTPILQNRDMNYFIDLTDKYQLNEKIYLDCGRLLTYADILPHDIFTLEKRTKTKRLTKHEIENLRIGDRSVITAAETYDGCYIADFFI